MDCSQWRYIDNSLSMKLWRITWQHAARVFNRRRVPEEGSLGDRSTGSDQATAVGNIGPGSGERHFCPLCRESWRHPRRPNQKHRKHEYASHSNESTRTMCSFGEHSNPYQSQYPSWA